MGDRNLEKEPADLANFLFHRSPILDPDKVFELARAGKGVSERAVGRYEQIEKSKWQKWVRGSAWWASALAFLVVWIITAAELTLFDLVIEEASPSLFPINDFYLSWLGIILGFSLAFFVGTERSLWGAYITQVQGIADDCLTLAWQITMFVNAKKLRDPVHESYIYTDLYKAQTNTTRKLYQIMKEINIIIRVFPMAVELDTGSRKGDKSPPIDEANWPDNLDELSLGALNLPPALLWELASYLLPNTVAVDEDAPQSAVSDQLLHMIGLRLHILLKAPTLDRGPERKDVAREFFGPNLFAGIDRQIGNIASRSSAIHANRIVSTNPIVKGLLISSTIIYALLVPLIPWGAYRWWTLLVAPLFQWVLLAFLFAGLKLEYQYVSYNKSNYVHVDTKQMAMNAAYAVDRVFDAYYRIGGIEHTPTFFSIVGSPNFNRQDLP